MYYMKNIIAHDEEITLPKCMYHTKNILETLKISENDIHINDQVSVKSMTDLERRQEDLMKKLDILYEKINLISSYKCSVTNNGLKSNSKKGKHVDSLKHDETVLVVSPDNLPWYLYALKKEDLSLSWHIHSSVPNEKVAKIKSFMKNLNNNNNLYNADMRLIFKNVSANSELKRRPLEIPFLGSVNILRYLASIYPNSIPYNSEDFLLENLLDQCYMLERTPEKNREATLKNIFSQYKDWIYNNQFSIVDIGVYSVIKQWQNSAKYVPKPWFERCEKMIK